MSIGKNIAKFRKSKNLTQEELGSRLGVTNQAVSKWESGASMPDIMLLPQIASVLEITLDDLYGIEKAPEKTAVSADEFPAFAYGKLHELFFNYTRMRFKHINSSDEAQISYQLQQLKNGCRIGCVSNTQGAVVMTGDFAFIDCDYKSSKNEAVIRSQGDADHILTYLNDRNLRKVLSYQYKTAFENSKERNTEFSLDEIMQGCSLSECEAVEALKRLKEINVNETYIDHNSRDKKYIFKISNALYALAIYKLAQLLSEDDYGWTVVRDTSMISDYAF